jgi:hypothetical protein
MVLFKFLQTTINTVTEERDELKQKCDGLQQELKTLQVESQKSGSMQVYGGSMCVCVCVCLYVCMHAYITRLAVCNGCECVCACVSVCVSIAYEVCVPTCLCVCMCV